jgi:catechol 2,3-dioxygenase-like lactoylglutathione lyase family enzyme
MSVQAKFEAAFPYQDDVLALPVANLDQTSQWYSRHFGMEEVERSTTPVPSVVLQRDGTRIGFAINGGDPTQEGAAVLVTNIEQLKQEFEANGLTVGDFRIDQRDDKQLKVFFVVAPDGLCFYFHEPIE